MARGMQWLKDGFGRLARNTCGSTSIEYGLIAALVAVGMLVGLRALGTGASSSWGQTSSKLTDAMKK